MFKSLQSFRLTTPLLLIGLTSLLSCDRYDDPVLQIMSPCDENELPGFEPLSSDFQRVLVEDFTAHQCGACPPAGLQMKQLFEEHPGQVIPLAIHAGPLANTNSQFPTDWRCEEGNQFWDDIGSSLNPVGRVNRRPTEVTFLGVSQWAEEVEGFTDNIPMAGIQMEIAHDTLRQKTTVHVHVTWFDNVDGSVRLSLLISENNLVAPQLWYPSANPPGPGFVENYTHNHVLRGSINGAKGLVIATGVIAGDTQQHCYTFQWNSEWRAENSEIIALLTDDGGAVIQGFSSTLLP